MAPFLHSLRVRYNECDQQNAVFNANHLVYFDVTITELWREAFGSYGAMAKLGVDLVVAEANIRYLKPAHFDDVLDVALSIERFGTTSMMTRVQVARDGTPITEGVLRYVVIDLKTGGKTPIPDAVRDRLEPYVGRPSDGN